MRIFRLLLLAFTLVRLSAGEAAPGFDDFPNPKLNKEQQAKSVAVVQNWLKLVGNPNTMIKRSTEYTAMQESGIYEEVVMCMEKGNTVQTRTFIRPEPQFIECISTVAGRWICRKNNAVLLRSLDTVPLGAILESEVENPSVTRHDSVFRINETPGDSKLNEPATVTIKEYLSIKYRQDLFARVGGKKPDEALVEFLPRVLVFRFNPSTGYLIGSSVYSANMTSVSHRKFSNISISAIESNSGDMATKGLEGKNITEVDNFPDYVKAISKLLN